MIKFIVWVDDRKDDARVVEADNAEAALAWGEGEFGVDLDKLNIIEEEQRGAADYYGVADAE